MVMLLGTQTVLWGITLKHSKLHKKLYNPSDYVCADFVRDIRLNNLTFDSALTRELMISRT